MLKKTTDIVDILTHNDKDDIIGTELQTDYTRLDKKSNRTKTMTEDKKENKKLPHLAFLKIYYNYTLQTFASHLGQPADQSLQKSAILPSH